MRAQFYAWALHWREQARGKETQIAGLLGGTAILWALMRLALRSATSRRQKRREPPLPTFFERAVSAFKAATLRLLPVLIASFVLYFGLDALDLVQDNPWGRLVPTFLKGVLLFAGISGLAAAVLAPRRPNGGWCRSPTGRPGACGGCWAPSRRSTPSTSPSPR